MPPSPHRPVLIVDDDGDIREALARYLEVHGYQTAAADNGATALAMLLTSAVVPCLILLDLHMPVMDGTEFREYQRLDPQLADLPVIIYSGAVDVRRAANEMNVAHYFQKPLDLQALVSLARRYCQSAPSSQTRPPLARAGR